MKKASYLAIWLLFSIFRQGYTQEINTTGAVSFLEILPDARARGMGNASTASTASAFAFLNNSSMSAFSEEKTNIAYSFNSRMKDLGVNNHLHALGGFFKIDDKQSVLFGGRYFTYSGIDITDENGNITESFKPAEFAVDLGYAINVIKNLSVSAVLRYVRSDMGEFNNSEAGQSVAFDFSLSYRKYMKNLERAYWSAGAKMTNIGQKIKYATESYELPGKISLGGAIYLPFTQKHQLEFAIDCGYKILPADISYFDCSIGAEYTFLKWGILRSGYHISDKNKGYGNYYTIGAGVKLFNMLHADFAYIIAPSNNPIQNTFSLSAGITLK